MSELTGDLIQFGLGDGSTTVFRMGLIDPVPLTSTAPVVYRSNWEGTVESLPTPRTNKLLNALMVGGGASPTSWSVGVGTGTSTPVASVSGGPGTAYSQSAVAQRPYFAQSSSAVAANSVYCLSAIVESASNGAKAGDCIIFAGNPVGSVISWPVCPANPSGGGTGTLRPGVLLCLLTVAGTAGNASPRLGLGANGNATGDITFSHPQLELGSSRTSWISTGSATTVTDHAVSGLTVTFATAPGVRTILKRKWLDQFGRLL